MNEIKLAGRIINVDNIETNPFIYRITISVPLKTRLSIDNIEENLQKYISFLLINPNVDEYTAIQKGVYIEVIGEIVGNTDEAANDYGDELIVIPKAFKKGVIKNVVAG